MARPIWKGHITFGLVNVPVTLFSAEARVDLHFQMLDSRNHARVRYERVNELTGEEVPWDEIVKAYEFDDDNYVLVRDEELKPFKAEANQAVEISAFVTYAEVDARYFEKPYYLVPGSKGEKGYVLLRETLRRTGKIGIARVTIRTREYLAALIPVGRGLVLNLMRFEQELRKPEEYDLPGEDLAAYKVQNAELEVATQLVHAMTRRWEPDAYRDDHRLELLEFLKQKADRGETAQLAQPPRGAGDDDEDDGGGGTVVDMMDLLKRSMQKQGKDGSAAAHDADEAAAAKPRAKQGPRQRGDAPAAKSSAKANGKSRTTKKRAPADKTAAQPMPARRRAAG